MENLNLTDEEIISELRSASEWFTEHGRNTNTAIIGICNRAINFIVSQRVQIEKLKAHNESLMVRCTDIRSAVRTVAELVKIEVYKEYGELNTSNLIQQIDQLAEKICGKE